MADPSLILTGDGRMVLQPGGPFDLLIEPEAEAPITLMCRACARPYFIEHLETIYKLVAWCHTCSTPTDWFGEHDELGLDPLLSFDVAHLETHLREWLDKTDALHPLIVPIVAEDCVRTCERIIEAVRAELEAQGPA